MLDLMDNLFINKISNMDYWSLVNLLMTQITPEIRKIILEKLTNMNDFLLGITRQNPLPLSMPVNSNQMYGPMNSLSNSTNYNSSSYLSQIKESSDTEIDLDDIIDELSNEQNQSNELDAKLEKISRLYRKIQSDRKNRKKNKN